jgi:uncharacterized membrane protein
MEAMDGVTIARALHVVFVVLWIGGVAFVTTVLLPAARRLKTPHERMQLFDQIERRFAWQARISTAIVGLTGFYMLYRFDMWDRFRLAAYWWIDAMAAVWVIFTLMLFIVEPFNLHRWFLGRFANCLQAPGMAAPNSADHQPDHCAWRCYRVAMVCCCSSETWSSGAAWRHLING